MNNTEKQPKVSIFVVSHNTEKYVEQCLNSIVAQTMTDFEVLWIDNGSTDRTVEIIKGYAEKDPRFICKFNPVGLGYGNALNECHSMAKGEYIYMMDSDDWIEPNLLELCYGTASEKDLQVLNFDFLPFHEGSGIKDFFGDEKVEQVAAKRVAITDEVISGKELFRRHFDKCQHRGVVWIYFFQRKFLERHRTKHIFEKGDDTRFVFETLIWAERTFHINHVLHHYRRNLQSESVKKVSVSVIESATSMYFAYLALFHSHGLSVVKDYSLYREILRSRCIILNMASELQGLDSFSLERFAETLYNAEHFTLRQVEKPLPSPLPIQFFTKKNVDTTIFNENGYFCFGAGRSGVAVLKLLEEKNLPLPSAFCDNNKAKHGTELQGIPILSLEEIKSKHPNWDVLITNDNYGEEILLQLLDESYEKVHRLFLGR